MHQNCFRILFVFLIALVVGGCFEYEEEMVLNRDGSGSLTVHISKLKDVKIDDNYDWPEDEEEIHDRITEKWTSKHVKLVNFRARDREKTQDVDFTLKFDNVLDLNNVDQFMDSQIDFKPGADFYYRRIISTDSDDSYDEDENSTFGKIIKSIVVEALDNLKFRYEIKMPKDITDNNADWVRNKRNAIWRFTAADLVNGKFEMIVNCE